jgi:hypothetical protein
MANRDFLFDIAQELRSAIRPLEKSLTSPEAFVEFLERYGVQPDPDALDVDEIRVLFAAVDDLTTAAALSRELLTPGNSTPPLETYADLVGVLIALLGRVRAANIEAPSGVNAGLWAGVVADLPEGLIADYLESHHRVLLAVFLILGVVEERRVEANDATGRLAYIRRRIFWERLALAVSDLGALMQELYSWNSPDAPLDSATLFERLERAASLLGIPTELESPPADILDAYYSDANPHRAGARSLRLWLLAAGHESGDSFGYTIRLVAVPSVGEPMGMPRGLTIAPAITSSGVTPAVVVWPFSLEFSDAFQSDLNVRLEVFPDRVGIELGNPLRDDVDAELTMVVEHSHPHVLVGSRYSHRLQAKGWSAGLRVTGRVRSPECVLEVALKSPELVIDGIDFDSFLKSSMGDESRVIAFDAAAIWSSRDGLYFRGQGGLRISCPISLAAGPIALNTLTLDARAESGEVGLTAGVSGNVAIGPVAISVENVGLGMTVTPVPRHDPPGVLGDLDLGFDFKPPDGLGISVDTGPITGAGFLSFDRDAGRYSGILQLEMYGINVQAIGLLDTQLPGGAYSFLIIISVEFTPVQIGFGFTLNGVGGLVGIHRGIAVDALQAGIRDDTLDHILFPDDPVRDAPQLISDLRAVFPSTENQHIVGPMALLGWGTPTLLEAKLAILVELPDPIRITLLGQLSAQLPTKETAIVELHIDVLGIVDFGQKLCSIDAVLHDSRVALFSISGGMAFRLSWADPPSFALSLGGLNPAFQPPSGFPALERLTVALGVDDNPRISLQAYLALTSNSLQFGAKAELYAAAGDFNLYGWIEFDALVTFSPLYFIVDFSAGVAIRWGDDTIAGVHLEATLEGPTPWHAWGEAGISILFFDISVDFDVRVGEERRDRLPPTDPWPLLEAAIADARNWSALNPPAATQVVALRTSDENAPAVLVDPVGGATMRQRITPLNRPITKFGEAEPSGPGRYDVVAVQVGDHPAPWSVVRDYFPPGHFTKLSDDEKLSRPSFEKMDAGLTVASDAVALGSVIGVRLEYETTIIDSPWDGRAAALYAPLLSRQLSALGRGASALSPLRHSGLRKFELDPRREAATHLDDEAFVIASTIDLSQRADISGPVMHGDAVDRLSAYLELHPEEAGVLEVIPTSQLQRAA